MRTLLPLAYYTLVGTPCILNFGIVSGFGIMCLAGLPLVLQRR